MTDVSVVIPAHNAAHDLARTLEALARQDFDGSYEVIVVDDGSTDGTGEIARAAGVRVVGHATARGPADARNSGAAQARGELLAFTDADCVPARGWLRAGVAACRDADLVQGRVAPDPGVPVGPWDHTIEVARESLLYETANLFVRRGWFERVGGFRAFIPPEQGHFGEDVVFAWQARRLGARAGFAADALVHHAVVKRPASAWLRERRRLRLFPLITREVPELRQRYVHGVFLSPRTKRFDLAAAGAALALARRRPWPLLLTLPYLHHDLQRRELRRRWVVEQNLTHVAGDAIGLVALVRGSVESRTVVL